MGTCSAVKLESVQEASDAPLWLRHNMEPTFLQCCQTCLQVWRAHQGCNLPNCKSSSKPTSSSRFISCCWHAIVRLCENVDKHSSHRAQAACLQRGPAQLTALYQKVHEVIRHNVTPVSTARPAFCQACVQKLSLRPVGKRLGGVPRLQGPMFCHAIGSLQTTSIL